MAALFVVLFFAVRAGLERQFTSLEQRSATTDVSRVRSALDEQVRSLDRAGASLAARGSTYRYMSGQATGFAETELNDEALSQLMADVVLFVDDRGRVAHAYGIDLDLGTRGVLSKPVVEALRDSRELYHDNDPRGCASGLIAVPGQVMIVSAHSITTADRYSPPNGTLVLARAVDAEEAQRLSDMTKLRVSTYALNAVNLDADSMRAMSEMADGAALCVHPLSERTMGAYAAVPSIEGPPALLMRAELPRDVYARGEAAASFLAVSLLLVGASAMGSVILAVDRTVLSRLALLSTQVARVGFEVDPSRRVTVEGKDEIADLAADVNGMLDALEASGADLARARDELERRVEERTDALARSEQRYRMLLERMADAVFSVDLDGVIAYANERAQDLTGWPVAELIGRHFRELVSPESALAIAAQLAGDVDPQDTWTMEVELGDATGQIVPVELRAAPLVDQSGNVVGTQWIARDVAERKRFEQQLVHMANHDHLTGLYNRRFFETTLDLELAEARRSDGRGAVLWLDLDDFKEINDSLGHRAGDEVLVAVTDRLRTAVRESNMLARIGGDEFAVLLPGVTIDEAQAAAGRLLGAVNGHSYAASSQAIRLSASVGVVAYPDHGLTSEELMANADVSMYLAKERGRGQVHIHEVDQRWRTEVRARMRWNERVTRALREQRFRVFAQPVMHVRTRTVARHELLIRMTGEKGRIILPIEFLPAAERLGLIHDIDRWMTQQAAVLLGEHPGLHLEVNLSGRAFNDPELLPAIERAIAECDVRHGCLGFEITETAAIADISRAQAFIHRLKGLGCRFSLDDFGSGFSSFYYLKHLPIDCLKVDGSYVRALAHSSQDRCLVRGMVELSRGLGIEVAAEYVEDAETLDIVGELGVDYAQGYHIGRPVPVEEALEGWTEPA